jgi:hypothetical protein
MMRVWLVLQCWHSVTDEVNSEGSRFLRGDAAFQLIQNAFVLRWAECC